MTDPDAQQVEALVAEAETYCTQTESNAYFGGHPSVDLITRLAAALRTATQAREILKGTVKQLAEDVRVWSSRSTELQVAANAAEADLRTVREEREFQRARADKWVAVAEKRSLELQAVREERDALQALREAFMAGQAASLSHEPRTANPFPPGDSYGVNDLWANWDDGYDCNITRALKAQLAALEAERTALRTALEAAMGRMFPIQRGPSIPWVVIRPCEDQHKKNHGGQGLEEMARRGGLGVTEAIAVLLGVNYFEYWEASGRFKRGEHDKHVEQLVSIVGSRLAALAASPSAPKQSERFRGSDGVWTNEPPSGPTCATCGHAESEHYTTTGLGECYALKDSGGLCQCSWFSASPSAPKAPV